MLAEILHELTDNHRLRQLSLIKFSGNNSRAMGGLRNLMQSNIRRRLHISELAEPHAAMEILLSNLSCSNLHTLRLEEQPQKNIQLDALLMKLSNLLAPSLSSLDCLALVFSHSTGSFGSVLDFLSSLSRSSISTLTMKLQLSIGDKGLSAGIKLSQALLCSANLQHFEFKVLAPEIDEDNSVDLVEQENDQLLSSEAVSICDGILEMNKAGRKYYITNNQMNKAKGVEVLAAVTSKVDCLFLHLMENPFLCRRDAKTEEFRRKRKATGQRKRDVPSSC